MFSYHCTLKAYWLTNDAIWGGTFLKPLNTANFFEQFPLVPPFAKSQKMRVLAVLAKFVIARLCGHLWSCRLRQNVLLWLHLCIVIKKSYDSGPHVFQAPKYGLLFSAVFLGLPFAKSQKMRVLGFLAKFFTTPLCGHLWSYRLR